MQNVYHEMSEISIGFRLVSLGCRGPAGVQAWVACLGWVVAWMALS